MLKINLLPPYIHQRRQVRIAVTVVVLALAAEIGLLVAARSGPVQERDRLQQDLTAKQAELTKLQGLGQQAQAVQGEEAAFKPKFEFINGMLTYNTRYPDLFMRTARYTYREVMFLDLEATPNQLKFNAYVTEPADVSRLILGLSRNTVDFAGLPQVTGVPGYTAAERQREQAMQAGIPTQSTIIGEYRGPGAAGGPAGVPGGMPGGMPFAGGNGPAGMPGSMMDQAAMGGNGPAGAPYADSAPGAYGGSPYGGAMSGMEGMGMASGGGGGLANLPIQGATLKPKGFTITVTCALRSPITRPTYPGMTTPQAGGGMYGGELGGYGGSPYGGGPSYGGPMGGNGPS